MKYCLSIFVFVLIATVNAQQSPNYEFRGVWVASVENIDWDSFGFAPWISKNDAISNIVGPSWMRLAIFLFFFASGLFVYAISGSFSKLTQFERSSITLLFLLLPFNTARVSLMTFHYSQQEILRKFFQCRALLPVIPPGYPRFSA